MIRFHFSVNADVFEAFPDYMVGWIAATIEPAEFDRYAVQTLVRAAELRSRTVYEGKDLKDYATFSVWRSAFSGLGWSGSKYPSSVEALTKRVIRGHDLPEIHPVVDIANAASLTYSVPVGCHDMEASPNLEIRRSRPGDTFLPIGSEERDDPPEGEIVYVHDGHVRTRRWVWRQSQDALVADGTTNLFMPIDGFREATGSSVSAAQAFLAASLQKIGNAEIQSGVVDAGNPSIAVQLVTD